MTTVADPQLDEEADVRLETMRPRAYDDAVRAHPLATPYHLWGFLRPAATALGLELQVMRVVEGGRTIGVLPLLIRSVGPAVLVNHRLPFPYVGALAEEWVDGEVLAAAVRRRLRPRPVLQVGLSARAPVPVTGRRWEVTAATTYVVPLDGADGAEAGFSRNRRRVLDAARKAGLVADQADLAEVRQELPTWAEATLRRQGLPPRLPGSLVADVAEELVPSGHAWPTAVRRGDETLAVSVDLLLGDRAYGWVVGISEAGRAAGAAMVLTHHLVRRAAEAGMTQLDMLGAPTPGIANFKQSVGAQPQPYTVARWISPAQVVATRLRSALGRGAR